MHSLKPRSAATLFALGGWLFLLGRIMRRLSQVAAQQAKLPSASAPQAALRVAVVVPMRDEGRNVQGCLDSIVAQQYPAEALHVVAVDDHSTDDTAARLRSFVRAHPAVDALAAPPLPEDWASGKSHACHTGALHALPHAPDYLLFVDADVRLAPQALASAVAYAETHEVDLLSVHPHQELVGGGERTLLFVQFVLLGDLLPLAEANDDAHPATIANGQFLLFRTAAYRRGGGHLAVRQVFQEDIALGQLHYRLGHCVRFLAATDLVSCRMYRSLREVWNGMSNTLVAVSRASPRVGLQYTLRYLAVAAGLFLLPGLLARLPQAPRRWAWRGYAAGAGGFVGLFVGGARYFRLPPYYALSAPLGILLQAALLANSLLRYWRGRYYWRGRVIRLRAGQFGFERLGLPGTPSGGGPGADDGGTPLAPARALA